MNDESILAKIVAATEQRVAQQKKELPLSRILAKLSVQSEAAEQSEEHAEPGSAPVPFAFEKTLKGPEIAFICEIKKASPSKGVIAGNFPYLSIAMEYQTGGAQALSVLTEPDFFHGSDRYLAEIKKQVAIPVLRKDFIVDEYQIYQAKLIGADAILLICAILTPEKLNIYLKIAERLGISALVETHDENETKMAVLAGARVIGVNNRDLKTFITDIGTSERLRELIPTDRIFVSESGVQTPADVFRLRKIGADAVLIGETLMRSPDKKITLDKLRGAC